MSDRQRVNAQNVAQESKLSGGVSVHFGSTESALQELVAAFLQRISSEPQTLPDSTINYAQTTLDESSLPSIEARYRVLVEQIPAVVFMAFLDGGLSEAYVSPQIEQMLGFTQEEWLDDPVRWYERIHPEDRARWSAEAAETLIAGKPLKSVYRVVTRDGRVVWFHCEAKLVRKKTGEPWFIHGVGFDITELKETEEALRRESAERERLQNLELERQIAKSEQTESRLAAIIQSSEDAIIGKGLDGTIDSWNAAATRLFGYKPHEAIGKSILLLVPPDLHDEEIEILQELKAGRHIAHRETQRLTKSGVRVDVSLTISSIKDAANRVIGGSTIARDITERKRAEEALRASEEKLRMTEKLAATGRLAATISHEINNPLEAVTNYIYLARQERSVPPEVRNLLDGADRELRRVAHIARQTLGFYRDSTPPVTINVAELLSDILELYRGKITYKNLRVQRQFDSSCEVRALQGEIRQVFSNVLINAIDASPDNGALALRVARGRGGKQGEKVGVRVTVADEGVGIPAAARGRIFEPFYSTKRDVGTGLGLWVSKSLVEKHGGSIRFRSSVALGRSGTVFSIFLPGEPSKPSVLSRPSGDTLE